MTARRIHAITTIQIDAALLPHWVAYYRWLGATDLHLLVNESGLTDAAHEILARHERYVRDRYAADYTSTDRSRREMRLKDQVVAPEDCYICCDVDEFHEYPRWTLQDVAQELWDAHCDYVEGRLVDHVSTDGSLTPVGSRHLWDQFPLEAPLTERLVQGDTNKVMLCRHGVHLERGRHRATGRPSPLQGRVHHFKWHAAVPSLLSDRLRIMTRTANEFAAESHRVLNHLAAHNGRISLDEIPSRRGTYRPDYLPYPLQNASDPQVQERVP